MGQELFEALEEIKNAKINLYKVKIRNPEVVKSTNKNGFVYFIQESERGLIKIGWAVDPYSRMQALQTGSASILTMIGYIKGTRKTEGEIHKLMASLRVRGEWFQNDKNIIQYAKERSCQNEC